MKALTNEVKKYVSKESPGDSKGLLLNIFCCLHEFYALIALDAIAKVRPFVHSHEKWEKDFHEYMEYFVSNLARVIYDYTVLAVLSELRHGCKSNLVLDIPNFMRSERYQIFAWAKEYTSNSILRTGEYLFSSDNNYWASHYGGDSWKAIAKAGLMYGKIPDLVFIDHCVDLCHNSGSYFDKRLGILACVDNSIFMKFLDAKKHSFNPYVELSQGVSYTFNNLVVRATNLEIIEKEKLTEVQIDRENRLFKYTACLQFSSLSDKRSFWEVYVDRSCVGASYFSDPNYFFELDLSEVFNYYPSFGFGEEDMTRVPKFKNDEKKYDEDGERVYDDDDDDYCRERRRGEY